MFFCLLGYYLITPCTTEGQRGTCEECEDGKYTEHSNHLKQCFRCTKCRSGYSAPLCHFNVSKQKLWIKFAIFMLPPVSDQEAVRPCTHSQNTECQCKPGGFCAPDEACEMCKTCSRWDSVNTDHMQLCWTQLPELGKCFEYWVFCLFFFYLRWCVNNLDLRQSGYNLQMLLPVPQPLNWSFFFLIFRCEKDEEMIKNCSSVANTACKKVQLNPDFTSGTTIRFLFNVYSMFIQSFLFTVVLKIFKKLTYSSTIFDFLAIFAREYEW